jgi:hypothetical protein
MYCHVMYDLMGGRYKPFERYAADLRCTLAKPPK